MVLVAVLVGVGLATVVRVLVLVVLDGATLVVTLPVRVGVGLAVVVGVFVLGVGLAHGSSIGRLLCHYMRMREDKATDPEDFSMAAEIFRLLADPTRVGLLHALDGGGERSVGELADDVGRRQTTVSQHLARLRVARLVTTRRQGTTVLYRLSNEHVGQLVRDALRHAEHLGPGTPAHHLEGPAVRT